MDDLNLHEMELHQTELVNECTTVTRVPGGWNYEYWSEHSGYQILSAAVFVPYSDEFREYTNFPF